MSQLNTYKAGPDENGHFASFGGRYVAETLMPLILEVEQAYNKTKNDKIFQNELSNYLKNYVAGRIAETIADLFLYAYGRCAHQKTSWILVFW